MEFYADRIAKKANAAFEAFGVSLRIEKNSIAIGSTSPNAQFAHQLSLEAFAEASKQKTKAENLSERALQLMRKIAHTTSVEQSVQLKRLIPWEDPMALARMLTVWDENPTLLPTTITLIDEDHYNFQEFYAAASQVLQNHPEFEEERLQIKEEMQAYNESQQPNI